MLQILSNDLTTWVDGGGKVHSAAIHPVQGREKVAKQVLASVRQTSKDFPFHTGIEMVNGGPALVARAGDNTFAVISTGIRHGKIHELWIVGNPDKLKHV